MSQPSDNILREAERVVSADQRDQIFMATAVDVSGQDITIRRPGQTVDEGPYKAHDDLTVSQNDRVVVVRVGSRYLVAFKFA